MASALNNSSTGNFERLQKVTELVSLRYKGCSPSFGSEGWTCAFSPDNRHFAWSAGNRKVTLVLCDRLSRSQASEEETSLEISIDTGFLVRSLTFAPVKEVERFGAFWPRSAQCKDLFLVTGHVNGLIRVWDVQSGNLLLQLLDHKDAVSSLSAMANGSGLLASTSFDGTIKVWDMIDEGNLTRTLTMNGGGKSVYACRWSPDSKSLATVGVDKNVCIWDASSFTARLQLSGHQHNVVACDFSPDSCLLATASWDTRVIIWDAQSGKMLKELFHLRPPPRLIFACGENGNWIRSVSFASDGAHLVSVSDDEIVRLWDINADYPEAIATVEQGLCCSCSPDGRYVAVGTRNGAAIIFKPRPCVKPLLFLSRSAFRRSNREKPLGLTSEMVPKDLLEYLNYVNLD